MSTPSATPAVQQQWLQRYYFLRAAFSFSWVALAFTAGQRAPLTAAILLVCYPAWDAVANLLDAWRSGGLGRNRTQAINVIVSAATTLAVALSLPDMHRVLAVFGAWAIVSGLLQLGTAVRRWKHASAQWAMLLSGGQSALAGAFFIVQAQGTAMPSILNLAGYAGVGAVYFLVSAVWLAVASRHRKPA